jgi:hypothetical protein
MRSKITETFNKCCEKYSHLFESWHITETSTDFYIQILPLGSVEVCCGCKKKSPYINRLNIDSLISYAVRHSKKTIS